ncbi:MAG: tripartite tricarboxylate transporter substrate binding protein [Pigmentiphaga sp.]|nr:tripartite tricarboxylate transporter substrate binding protein [Pigmentiphaga sp.]
MSILFHCARALPLGRVCAGLMVASLLTGGALAASYPDRPIQVVVPYGAGSADIVPRMATAAISERTGHHFIVDNRPGAGGLIGTQYVLRQPADGYNVLVAATNNILINQLVYESHKIEPLKELTPVAKLVTVPLIVGVNADLPIHSLAEMVEYGRKGNTFDFSSPSVGTPPHIAAESLLHTLGLKGMHIPYKGRVAMATAVGSGEVQLAVVAYATLQSVIASGRVRPLAVVSAERLTVLPDVPTVTEAGYPQLMEAIPPNWWSFTVKAGTPEPIVADLAKWTKEAMADSALQESYRKLGMVPSFEDAETLRAGLAKEAEQWKELVTRLEIRAD